MIGEYPTTETVRTCVCLTCGDKHIKRIGHED